MALNAKAILIVLLIYTIICHIGTGKFMVVLRTNELDNMI